MFDYSLPKEKIAQKLYFPRDHCKLLVLRGDAIEHRRFYEVVKYLKKGDALVLNNTKVMKVKLHGKKITGGKIELLIIRGNDGKYECLIKGKVKEGTRFFVNGYEGEVLEKKEGKCLIKLNANIDEIENHGKMPSPPYIKRDVDENEYQTVFAMKKGSIAAPTAGLHFTSELLKKLREKGVDIVFITLHVGLATFMPPEKMREEKEYFCISEEAAERINEAGRVIAVGTTTVKALESSSKNGRVVASSGYSNLFISPPYKFNSPIEGIITNFHMPKSTPLMLISAFAGEEKIMKAYKEALKKDYKFLSLGDAMLILKCSR